MNDNSILVEMLKTEMKKINRKGIPEFVDWLAENTDFFEAPASTRYHGAEEHGLVFHSLAVYSNLYTLANHKYTRDTIALVSLFHDLCKANYYVKSSRNVKNEVTGIWEKVPCYTVNEQLPFGGHGSKSVYLLMKHGIELSDEEATAINCHMGGWDSTTYSNPSGAFNKYPLAVYLHLADMLATYIDKQ